MVVWANVAPMTSVAPVPGCAMCERGIPMGTSALVGVFLNGSPHIISWGWLQITLANLIVIGLMALVFAAAVLTPFPGRRK